MQHYADFIEKEYCEKGYKALFVYLTPNGEIPSDNRWKKMNYRDLYDITCTARGNIADDKIKGIAEDYRDILLEAFATARDFKDCITRSNESVVCKDFPDLECVKVTAMNALLINILLY